MRLLAVLGMLCAVASIGTAQRVPTAADTNSAARVRVARDSVSCPIAPLAVSQRCVRARLRLDSIRTALMCPRILAPTIPPGGWFCPGAPPPPVNQKPVARFTVSIAGNTATFNASTSTDDKGIASYTWRPTDPNRPVQTGVTITREVGAGDPTFTEWLIVRDSAGLVDSTSRVVTPPPLPGPGPVVSIDVSLAGPFTVPFYASRNTDTLGTPTIAWSDYAPQPAPFDTVTVCAVVTFPTGQKKVGWPPVRISIGKNNNPRGDSVYAIGNRSGNPLSQMCGNAVAADGVVVADSVPVTWSLTWLRYSSRWVFYPLAVYSPP